jgi:hypothetical protein
VPECDRLMPQVGGWEMGSAKRRYGCPDCEMGGSRTRPDFFEVDLET